MNYQRIHDEIVANARNRQLTTYSETHHIVPKCIGGLDVLENLVEITYREHFILHWLLTKINPNEGKLVVAFHLMSHQTSNSGRPQEEVHRRTNSRTYAINKEKMAKLTSERFAGVPKSIEQRDKMRTSAIKRWKDPVRREAQSQRMIGNTLSKGRLRLHSDETKQKISAVLKEYYITNPGRRTGAVLSEETKQKISESKSGVPLTPEHRKKLADAQRGTKRSNETKQKMAAKKAKTWRVTTPEGGKPLIITNLRQFCKEHGLNQGNLSTYGQTKGYYAEKVSSI